MPALVAMAVSAPAWSIAYKKKYLKLYEVFTPILTASLWLALVSYSNGMNKSLAHLIEVVLFIPMTNVLTAYLKTFVLSRRLKNSAQAAGLYVFFNIIISLVIIFMVPALPE